MSGPGIVAAVVTHRRPVELRRLALSLAACTPPPNLVAVADHAPDGSSCEALAIPDLNSLVVEDANNPGPGAGWSRAAAAALARHPEARGILFLDDDVVVSAGALASMEAALDALGEEGLVAPLLEDSGGKLWAFPEPVDRNARRLIRRAATPAEVPGLLGHHPQALCWCTGACVLVTTALYRRIGPHREDFFLLGEDLEFSMRAAAMGQAVFLPGCKVAHWPPEGGAGDQRGKIKFCSLLQNLCYLSFHSPYSRHMKRYLPGNFRRYLRTYGAGACGEALRCFLNGAVYAEPAGGPRGTALRSRLASKA